MIGKRPESHAEVAETKISLDIWRFHRRRNASLLDLDHAFGATRLDLLDSRHHLARKLE